MVVKHGVRANRIQSRQLEFSEVEEVLQLLFLVCGKYFQSKTLLGAELSTDYIIHLFYLNS